MRQHGPMEEAVASGGEPAWLQLDVWPLNGVDGISLRVVTTSSPPPLAASPVEVHASGRDRSVSSAG